MVTICTASLTFSNSTFCQQCTYVLCVDLRTNSNYFPTQHQLTGFCNRDGECLLRGTDWAYIYVCVCIYIYIHTYVCVCVCIYIYHVNLSLQGRATFQAVSRRPLAAEVRVRSQYIPYEICGKQNDTRRGSSPSISVPPVSIIPPILHTHLHLYVAVTRKTNGQSLGTLQKAMKFRKSDSIV